MFAKFKDCQEGNIAIFASLLLLPVLMLAGVGVEYSRISNQQKVLQSTLDYVPVDPRYAARYRRNAERYLEGFIHANSGRQSAEVNIELHRNMLKIEAKDEIDTPLLGIMGQEKTEITASLEVYVPDNKGNKRKRSSSLKR